MAVDLTGHRDLAENQICQVVESDRGLGSVPLDHSERCKNALIMNNIHFLKGCSTFTLEAAVGQCQAFLRPYETDPNPHDLHHVMERLDHEAMIQTDLKSEDVVVQTLKERFLGRLVPFA